MWAVVSGACSWSSSTMIGPRLVSSHRRGAWAWAPAASRKVATRPIRPRECREVRETAMVGSVGSVGGADGDVGAGQALHLEGAAAQARVVVEAAVVAIGEAHRQRAEIGVQHHLRGIVGGTE